MRVVLLESCKCPHETGRGVTEKGDRTAEI